MTLTRSDHEVTRSIELDATPAEVWDALLSHLGRL